jgi:hypothetical protein
LLSEREQKKEKAGAFTFVFPAVDVKRFCKSCLITKCNFVKRKGTKKGESGSFHFCISSGGFKNIL